MIVDRLNREIVGKLALPEGKNAVIFWDGELKGFGLKIRVDTKGRVRRGWFVQYRVNGGPKQRKMKLGDFEKLDVTRARIMAKELLARVCLGGDPQGDKRRAQRNGGGR
jgi:hypothetical protein